MSKKDAVIKTSDLRGKFATKTNLHLDNLVRGSFYTTTEWVTCCLLKHLGKIESKSGWKAPAGVLFTIIITFATTDFKNALFMSAESWRAFAAFVGFACVIQIIRTIPAAFTKHTVEDVVLEIQRGNGTPDGQNASTNPKNNRATVGQKVG